MAVRFQFSLASLLLGTAVVAGAVNWWTLRQRLVAARQKFDAASAFYDVGTGALLELTRASNELLAAELAMPLIPNDRIAWLSYLARTRHLQKKVHATAESALFGSMGAMVRTQRSADELLDECQSVEDRLGLPHVDNDYFRTENGRYAFAEDDGEYPSERDDGEVPLQDD